MGKKEVAAAIVGSVKNAKDMEKECDVLTKKSDSAKSMETDGNDDKKEEAKTPVASAIERPVRERKSVKRLVASYEIDVAKELFVLQGRGTALKDIPNVAFKLSKRKTDETFKLLHTIVFGRRAKASQVKNNISRFSGFPWDETEEKENKKVKERLDRCVKEKLLDICDVLDIPIARATTKKEDMVAKLMEFLGAPHATTTELLSEKEQSSKGNKRKRVTKGSASTPGSSKRSAKSLKGSDESSELKEKKNESEADDSEKKQEETEENPEEVEEEKEQDTVDEVPKISNDETLKLNEIKEEVQHAKVSEEGTKKRKRSSKGKSVEKAKTLNDSEEKEAELAKVSEEDTKKRKRVSKKDSVEKAKTKEVAYSKESIPVPEIALGKSSSSGDRSKSKDKSNTSPKSSSGKKEKKEKKVEIKKSSSPKKSAPKEKSGKKAGKGKEEPKEDKMSPSDDELNAATCKLLKEVDFNVVTFNDILKQLGNQFNTNLMKRKSSVKAMIQAELTKIANDEEED